MHAGEAKVTITVYGSLSCNKSRTTDFLFYRITNHFFSRGKLDKVICLAHDDDTGIDEALIRSPGPLFGLANRLVSFLGAILPGRQERMLREWLFDLYCSRQIGGKQRHILLNLKPLVPMTVRTAIRKTPRNGLRVVTLATTAHPRFNYEVIRKLQSLYNLPNRSSYTNEARVRRMEQTFLLSDKTLLMVRSHFIRDTYRQHGIDERALSFLGNSSAGVDTTVFKPGERRRDGDKLIYLTLGNLTLIKGTPLLLDAWQATRDEGEINAQLIMSGKVDADLQELLHKRDWGDSLTSTGFVPDLVAAYQEADVFIAASVSDNGPATVLEAMACGLPVIVSRHCGFSEYIEDGREGFTYDPFDTEALKEHITWFWRNRDKIQAMGERARQRSMSFQVTDYIDQVYAACYPEDPGTAMPK